MLYDPKWEKKTERKQRGRFSRWRRPVTIEEAFEITDFTSWVACQAPSKRYRFTDPLNCALAQYLKERGVGEVRVLMAAPHTIHPALHALNTGGPSTDYTFGALHQRLSHS